MFNVKNNIKKNSLLLLGDSLLVNKLLSGPEREVDNTIKIG